MNIVLKWIYILASNIQYLLLKLVLFLSPRKGVMRGCVVDKGSVKKKTDAHHPETSRHFLVDFRLFCQGNPSEVSGFQNI